MAETNDQFKFDLDAKEAGEKLDGLLKKIKSIGDVENLAGLVEGLVSLAGPIAAVTVAMVALKAAFDLSAEGEQIQKIHDRFDALAQAVGVNSKEMEENIQKSIGTTEDLTDAIQTAGRAMSLLGSNSDKIPQFFEIAKKAAEAFGGTMNERFDQITNAVARGNAGMLRSIGITVDSQKALAAYAASINTTVGALSQQGRQAAIAEAILAKSQDRYKELKSEQEGIETATKRFATTWKDAGDTVAVAFNKMFGPAFTKAIEYFDHLLSKVSDHLKANFGSDAEAAAAKSRILGREIENLTEKIEENGKTNSFYNQQKREIDLELKAQLQTKKNELALIQELAEEERKRASAEKGDKIIKKDKDGKEDNGDIDNEKEITQKAKFNQELLKLAEQRSNAELAVETNADEYRMQQIMQRNNMIAQMDAQIAEVKHQGILGETITKAQADELIIQMEREKAAKIEAINRDIEQKSIGAYDNQVKAARSTSQGISAAFAQGAKQAQLSMKDYGTQGQMVFKTISSNAAAAFKAMGDGSKSAGEAMKGFLFSSIADVAEAKGQFLLASGIGTMNGVEIAEGGALIALSGLLRSQAGSAGGGGVGGGSSGGGGGGGGASPSSSAITEKPQLAEDAKKNVTVQVMGHYFETEQTQTRLLEMIRASTDGTDFKYQQIGVGGK